MANIMPVAPKLRLHHYGQESPAVSRILVRRIGRWDKADVAGEGVAMATIQGGVHQAEEEAMAKQYAHISDPLARFIDAQKMFFVATAAPEGRVNLSPKGMDTLRVLTPNRVAWLSVTGSGNETAAHLLQDSRMTIMFCAFEGHANILRLYGRAAAHHHGDPEFTALVPLFQDVPGARNIFVLDVDLVQTSCGTAVPHMDYAGDRQGLNEWAIRKGDDGLAQYWADKNLTSLDGDPTGLPVPVAGPTPRAV